MSRSNINLSILTPCQYDLHSLQYGTLQAEEEGTSPYWQPFATSLTYPLYSGSKTNYSIKDLLYFFMVISILHLLYMAI